MTPSLDPAFLETSIPDKPGVAESSLAAEERIRPGDLIGVKVLGGADLTEEKVVVDRSGRIHLPWIGDIQVGGLTLSEGEQRAQERLDRYDRFGRVALQLLEGSGRIASVTGAVEKPGNVALTGDARLADVLSEVSGVRMVAVEDRLVPLGDLDGAQVVRDGEPLPIDFEKALRGEPRHNIRILPGDVIVVPPAVSGRVVVLGDVNKPRTLAFRDGMRLTEALADSGGMAKGADKQDVRVLRGGYANPKLYVADVGALFAGQASDVILAPGDIVYVSEHWFASVTDVLERIVPAVATAAVITALSTN